MRWDAIIWYKNHAGETKTAMRTGLEAGDAERAKAEALRLATPYLRATWERIEVGCKQPPHATPYVYSPHPSPYTTLKMFERSTTTESELGQN